MLLSTPKRVLNQKKPLSFLKQGILGNCVQPCEFTRFILPHCSETDYAVGVPKDDVLKGSVVFYTSNIQFITNITGEQIGEYYGYSIAVADFNGDG